jgi:hypothetical protein
MAVVSRHDEPRKDAALNPQSDTDVNLLPTFDAVASLDWEGNQQANGMHTDTHGDTQRPVQEGHGVSQADNKNGEENIEKTIASRGSSHTLTRSVTERKMVGAVRFELTTSCTRNKRASQTTLRPDAGRKL